MHMKASGSCIEKRRLKYSFLIIRYFSRRISKTIWLSYEIKIYANHTYKLYNINITKKIADISKTVRKKRRNN